MNKKGKVMFVFSSIFTVLSIIGLLGCLIFSVFYLIELYTPATPCDESTLVCVSLEGEPFIMIAYILVGLFTIIASILGSIFSFVIRKKHKLAFASFIYNLAAILYVITFFVVMLFTIN